MLDSKEELYYKVNLLSKDVSGLSKTHLGRYFAMQIETTQIKIR